MITHTNYERTTPGRGLAAQALEQRQKEDDAAAKKQKSREELREQIDRSRQAFCACVQYACTVFRILYSSRAMTCERELLFYPAGG